MVLKNFLFCVLLLLWSPFLIQAETLDLTKSESLPSESTLLNTSTFASKSSSDVVNINTADIKDLVSLPGIGKVKAQAIIDYRTQNGNFSACEDLDKVKGIGKKTVEKLKDRCAVR